MVQHIALERVQMRIQFDTICAQHHPWTQLTQETRETLVRRMERNCFEVVIEECKRDGIDRLFTEQKFVDRYSSICSRVLANLSVNGSVGSTYLLDGVISGSINAYKVAEMDSFALCPDASKSQRDEISVRQNQKVRDKVCNAYWCVKCNGNETIPIEYQALAADEGSSRSIKCVICGYVWRKI